MSNNDIIIKLDPKLKRSIIDMAIFFLVLEIIVLSLLLKDYSTVSFLNLIAVLGILVAIFIIFPYSFYRLSQYYFIINHESIIFRNNKRIINIPWKNVSYIEIMEIRPYLKIFQYRKYTKIRFKERNEGNLFLSLIRKGIGSFWFLGLFHMLSNKRLISTTDDLIPIGPTEDDMQFKALIVNYLRQAHPEVKNIPSDF